MLPYILNMLIFFKLRLTLLTKINKQISYSSNAATATKLRIIEMGEIVSESFQQSDDYTKTYARYMTIDKPNTQSQYLQHNEAIVWKTQKFH